MPGRGAVFHSGAVIRYPGGESMLGHSRPHARRLLDDLTRSFPSRPVGGDGRSGTTLTLDPTAIWPGLKRTLYRLSDLPEDCPADKILIRASTLEEIRQVRERYLPQNSIFFCRKTPWG